MLKTKIYTILTIYVLSCIGVAINFHYCGGKLQSVSLYLSHETDCCGTDEESKGCCENKSIVVDNDDTEGVKSYTIQNYTALNYIFSPFPVSTSFLHDNWRVVKNIIPLDHAPPNLNSESLFIKHSILLI